MRGINRYNENLKKAKSESLTESAVSNLLQKSASTLQPERPCIFMSHKREDKEATKKLGEFIKDKGIDIYLDIEDRNLQKAIRDRDDSAITKFIELGILSSTDLLVVVSDITKNSWWVPYEMGFAKKANKYVRILKLKDVRLPSFMQIAKTLSGTASFSDYIFEVSKRIVPEDDIDKAINEAFFNLNKLQEFASGKHALESYLDVGQ